MNIDAAQAPYKTGDQEHSEAVILPYEKKAEYFVEDVGEVNGKTAYCVIKRIFDILLSLIALVVLAIPMLIIALIIKLSSKGTVFYHQERLGLNGKPFNIIKFRTMRMDAEANGAQWSEGDDDPEVDPKLNFTFNEAVKRDVKTVLSNTFGFGSHNACLILKKYEG